MMYVLKSRIRTKECACNKSFISVGGTSQIRTIDQINFERTVAEREQSFLSAVNNRKEQIGSVLSNKF